MRPNPEISDKRKSLGRGKLAPSEAELIRHAQHVRHRPGLSLARFVSAGWHVLEPQTPLEWNWHLDVLCDHIQALILDAPGTPTNLLINVPPGSMKSLAFSVFAPAWAWLFRPSWRAIYASGTPSVVTRDSLKCRQLVSSEWYQRTFRPAWRIAPDQNEKQHFANTAGGFRKGVGAGGVVTGERADFLGVDDPNDAKEIHSEAHRIAINERWWSAAYHNRVADPSRSKRGIIMQRLHEEDLAGFVLARERGQWEHLCIPMECEGPRPPTWLGWTDPRKEGEILAPRFTPAYLANERAALGSAGYAGQMQQRPSSAEGNQFKRQWWKFFVMEGESIEPRMRPTGCSTAQSRPIKRFDRIVQSWDMTFKDGSKNDFVVGMVLGVLGADRFVLDVVRGQWDLPATLEQVRSLTKKWPQAAAKFVEDKANGPAVVQTLKREIPGLIEVTPEGGKESRAAGCSPQIEAGNVYLLDGAPWVDAMVEEFAAFPRGKHDDQVDALSQGLIRLGGDVAVQRARWLLSAI